LAIAGSRTGAGRNMVAGRFERIFITVLTALCGLTIGYTLPLYLELDWRWRLLALPATVLLGWFTWARYSRGHEPSVAFDLRPLWVAPPSRARSLCELRASCLPQIPCSRPKRPLRDALRDTLRDRGAEWREAGANEDTLRAQYFSRARGQARLTSTGVLSTLASSTGSVPGCARGRTRRAARCARASAPAHSSCSAISPPPSLVRAAL